MPKTVFTDNISRLYAAFANAIFGTGANGGHLHDGVDADGHCGKIDPINHINGMSAGTFAVTPAGFTGVTVQASWTKDANGIVRLTIPGFSGTANNNYERRSLYFFYSGGVPAAITPAADKSIPCLVIDEGIMRAGLLTVDSYGYLDWSLGLIASEHLEFSGLAFAENTSRGMPSGVFTYAT